MFTLIMNLFPYKSWNQNNLLWQFVKTCKMVTLQWLSIGYWFQNGWTRTCHFIKKSVPNPGFQLVDVQSLNWGVLHSLNAPTDLQRPQPTYFNNGVFQWIRGLDIHTRVYRASACRLHYSNGNWATIKPTPPLTKHTEQNSCGTW